MKMVKIIICDESIKRNILNLIFKSFVIVNNLVKNYT